MSLMEGWRYFLNLDPTLGVEDCQIQRSRFDYSTLQMTDIMSSIWGSPSAKAGSRVEAPLPARSQCSAAGF